MSTAMVETVLSPAWTAFANSFSRMVQSRAAPKIHSTSARPTLKTTSQPRRLAGLNFDFPKYIFYGVPPFRSEPPYRNSVAGPRTNPHQMPSIVAIFR